MNSGRNYNGSRGGSGGRGNGDRGNGGRGSVGYNHSSQCHSNADHKPAYRTRDNHRNKRDPLNIHSSKSHHQEYKGKAFEHGNNRHDNNYNKDHSDDGKHGKDHDNEYSNDEHHNYDQQEYANNFHQEIDELEYSKDDQPVVKLKGFHYTRRPYS